MPVERALPSSSAPTSQADCTHADKAIANVPSRNMTEKFACRSCRYDRCIELGMTFVQPLKRKSRKRKEVEERQVECDEEGDDQPMETDGGPRTDDAAQSSSSSATSSTMESILDRMETEYKASHDRRLAKEKQYAAEHNLKRMDHPTAELYMGTVASIYESLRILIHESIVILQNVFPEFEHISIADRVIMFKNFLGKFCMVEDVFLSSKYFKNNFNFMTSLVTCVDVNDLDGLATETDAVERKGDFRSSLEGFSKDYTELLVPMLKMDDITEREFHALVALAYCDVVGSATSCQSHIEREKPAI